MNSPRVTVVPQSRETFLSGMELYRQRPDKRYSLTDNRWCQASFGRAAVEKDNIDQITRRGQCSRKAAKAGHTTQG